MNAADVYTRKILRGRGWVYCIFDVCLTLPTATVVALLAMGEVDSVSAIIGAVVCGSSVLYFSYHMSHAWRLAKHPGALPRKILEGYPLVTEKEYQHRVRSGGMSVGTGAYTKHYIITLAGQRLSLGTHIDPPPEHRPIRVEYIEIAMPFFWGPYARPIIHYQVLSETATATHEAAAARESETGDAAANVTGRLSGSQIRGMQMIRLKQLALASAVTVPMALILGFGGLRALQSTEAGMGSWIMCIVALSAIVIWIGIAIYQTRKIRDVPRLQVQHFTGQVTKVRDHPDGRVEAGACHLECDGMKYWTAFDELFQSIPQTRPATYYYVIDSGTKTIVHFSV